MRTTSRRQIALILCVLCVAMVLIGVFFRIFLMRSLYRERIKALERTSEATQVLVEAYSSPFMSTWDLRINLAVAAASSNSEILLCTPTGEVVICANHVQGCDQMGRRLSKNAVTQIFGGRKEANAPVSELYGDQRMAVATPMTDEFGLPMGILLVSVESSSAMELSTKALRIFIISALAVLAVMVLATPFLIRRENKSIRALAAAARGIAHGDLAIRVPTGHNNEEIEELSVAFNNMAVSLQHAETVRQEFVANVSHELKTPMTTISGYLDGMLDGTIPREKHSYYMELVSTEVRRLSRLVRNMLDVSRLRDQGIPEDKMGEFDICETAGQALLSFEQRINRKELNVDIDMPDLGLSVHGANDLITQVLYNLIDNAVKFVEEAGTLSIRILRRGNKAVVTVGNTGPTIPPGELPLVFDRFHKTDKSRSTDRDGAGLGLYIVKTIILAHGEDVYVTSREGKTEFTFTLRAV
ncbi:MAG: HAMP domain-containing histidine kinase [Oscillospiraceae bacterium]|nr:HAMP domain-containing histidine kinase [Oscillospiraceae bacterium]